jgi:2-oxoglutarate dehydrogenase complex dehydrogenase (E1) component-like enzyme
MYQIVAQHPTVREQYAKALAAAGVVTDRSTRRWSEAHGVLEARTPA